MNQISRDPADLVGQTLGRHHQYPDGLVLFLGTLFAPTQDRDTPGEGFTHKIGDVVTISSPRTWQSDQHGAAVDAVPGMDIRGRLSYAEPRRAKPYLTGD
jgi:fumarylacetoacetate (FAA) hydrolase family protein